MKAMALGDNSLPFFYFLYEKARPLDSLSVLRQMKGRRFDPALILGTASRCRFGYPRVILCAPLRGLAPFPTSFWLTCPWLTRLAGTVESQGGVGELERWIERCAPREWIFFNMDHQRVRMALLPRTTTDFLRRFRPRAFDFLRRGGVGGIRCARHTRCDPREDSVRVKCIHLQTASWLATHRHPGSRWLEDRGLSRDCGGHMKMLCDGKVL
ncbi:MAG: DUF501 domain-containing protein [Synergistaceae bacterium]|nr:DUF501 domain-containing protein [Synergistaceae bacterium]